MRRLIPFVLLLVFSLTCRAELSPKDNLLESLVEQVATPGHAKLTKHSRLLAEAVEKLDQQPDAAALESARACWKEIAVTAQELTAFKHGPIKDGAVASTFHFVAVRPASIERGIQATRGQAVLPDLGAAAKGLFAIEHLLFEADALARLSGDEGKARRHYLRLIANENASQAEQLAKDWQAPYSESARRFLKGGQDSLNALVNQLAMSSEAIAMNRLEPLLNPEALGKTGQLPGAASGHSQLLALAAVRGIQRVHDGGLADYTRRLNPPLADQLDRQLASAVKGLAAFDRPLEAAGQQERLVAACAECQALNVLLKVDLPSTLGVTLTFISTDGD
jgi:predicted lipoprotein